jgi:hypothetical protein
MQRILAAACAFSGAFLLVSPISSVTKPLADSFLAWAGQPFEVNVALRGYPIMELETALKVCGGYLLLVALGLFRYQKPQARDPNAKSPARKESPLIKPLQIVYNLVQVGLCAYMITLAMQEYIAQGSSSIVLFFFFCFVLVADIHQKLFFFSLSLLFQRLSTNLQCLRPKPHGNGESTLRVLFEQNSGFC